MPDSPNRRWTDAACVALLLALSCVLFLRYASNFPDTTDGLTFNFLAHEGFLGYFNWEPAKIAGRPFVGVSYRLARDVFGGSILAQAVFQIACFTVTALAVYAVTRLLVPRFATLAWAAGVLKLTWCFHRNLHLNPAIIMVFSEMLFALALLGLVWCATRRGTAARRLPLAACVGLFILVAAGTYQALWPLILLVPVPLIPRLRRVGWPGWIPLIAWYTSFAAAAAVSLANLRAFPVRWVPFEMDRLLLNTGISARTVFIDSLWRPATLLASPEALPALVTAFVVTAVFVIVGVRLLPRDEHRPRDGTAAIIAWLAFGFALALAALLPPALKGPAVYGGRFANHAVWGWIVVALSLAALAFRSRRSVVRVGGGVLVACCVFLTTTAWGVWMREISREGATSHVFYLRMMEHLAGMEEGTVLFVRGRRHGTDRAMTTSVRMLSDTHETFWLHDAEFTRLDDGDLLVESKMLLNLDRKRVETSEIPGWVKAVRRPVPYANARMRSNRIESERRVTLRWNRAFNQYVVDERLSSTDRLRPSGVSSFGRVLYPRAGRWMGGLFVQRDVFDVVARDGAAPRRVFRHYDWYPPSCGLVAIDRTWLHDDAAATVDGDGDDVRIQLHVPSERPLALEFRYRGVSPHLHVRHTQGGTTWTESCDASPRTWRTPTLDPGFHTLVLRADPGTTVTLDAFALRAP